MPSHCAVMTPSIVYGTIVPVLSTQHKYPPLMKNNRSTKGHEQQTIQYSSQQTFYSNSNVLMSSPPTSPVQSLSPLPTTSDISSAPSSPSTFREDCDTNSSSSSNNQHQVLVNNHQGASKMKSSDVKNQFTISLNSRLVKCNRTSTNQKRHIGYNDIKQYFFLPEGEAAKKLGCSKSKLKRIKTRLNIERWPYRRIQSLLKQDKNVNKNLAVQFVLNYPNLITKYSNEDITTIATRMDRIRIQNLLH